MWSYLVMTLELLQPSHNKEGSMPEDKSNMVRLVEQKDRKNVESKDVIY